MEIETIIFTLLIIFFSSTIRATFGFGDALIAMPLLALFLPVKIATPIVAMIAMVISISILYKDWKNSFVNGYFALMISILIGVIIGVLYLKYADEKLIKIILALIILSFSVFKLINTINFNLKTDTYLPVFGIISGLLGGAYNVNGPPIVIYGTLRNWNPVEFRAKLQAIFFPTNAMIIISHIFANFWTNEVINLFLYALPIVIISIITGSKLNKRFNNEKFSKFVYVLLLLISLLLLFSEIFYESHTQNKI